jgi:hypothetical protein
MLFTKICICFQQRAKLDIMDYETLQKEMKKKKLDAQRKSRITVHLLICSLSLLHLPICLILPLMSVFFSLMQQVVKIPKVNRQMFDNILAEEEELDADVDNVDKSSTRKKKRRLELTKSLLTDPRFDEMFKNKVRIPVSNFFFELNFSNPHVHFQNHDNITCSNSFSKPCLLSDFLISLVLLAGLRSRCNLKRIPSTPSSSGYSGASSN